MESRVRATMEEEKNYLVLLFITYTP